MIDLCCAGTVPELIHAAHQAAQELEAPGAAKIVQHLHLLYPSHITSNADAVEVVRGSSSIDGTLHRLIVMLPSAAGMPGCDVYRKLRHFARRFPRHMLVLLPVLAAVTQTSAVEPLATWSNDPQSNTKALTAANLLLQIVGLLDALRPHVFSSAAGLVPLLSQLIAALEAVVPTASRDAQLPVPLAHLLGLLVQLLQRACAAGKGSILDALRSQLQRMSALLTTTAPALARALTELLRNTSTTSLCSVAMVAMSPSEEELTTARWRLRGLPIAQGGELHCEAGSRDWALARDSLEELSRIGSNQPSLLCLFVSELLEIVSVCPLGTAVQQAYQLLVSAMDSLFRAKLRSITHC